MLHNPLRIALIGGLLLFALPVLAQTGAPAPAASVDLPTFPASNTQSSALPPLLPSGTKTPPPMVPASPHPAPAPASIPPALPAPVTVPVPPPAAAVPAPVVLPPSITPPAQPKIPPAIPAAAPETSSSGLPAFDEVQKKNPAVILTPQHISGNTSVIFPKADMDVVVQLMELYDSMDNAPKQAATPANGDDLNSLLKELTSKQPDKTAAPAPVVARLPNIYLGSIVYYSPSHWSIWINDRKFITTRNKPENEFYITRISRTQVEFTWKPLSLLDMADKWNQMTQTGKHPLPNIEVNGAKGTVTLLMRANQTFLPRSLAIAEGLIKSGVTTSAPGAAAPTDDAP